MTGSATMHEGPLGSTIHVLRVDAETLAELAAIDWNRRFRRVCLDPVRGLIPRTSPSHLHAGLADMFDHIVDVAGSGPRGAAEGIRSTRRHASVRVLDGDHAPAYFAEVGVRREAEPRASS